MSSTHDAPTQAVDVPTLLGLALVGAGAFILVGVQWQKPDVRNALGRALSSSDGQKLLHDLAALISRGVKSLEVM